MSGDYMGLRYSVTPRRLRDGGICWDVSVMDGYYLPVWSYQTTSQEDGVRTARRWIDGTDRTVGFPHKSA